MNFLVGVVSADEWPVCLDLKAPSAPTGLSVDGNLELSWTTSSDLPSCSGVSHYNLYMNEFKRVHVDKSFVLVFKYDKLF